MGIKSRTYISTNIIKPLISDGLLEYTNIKSINARNQKYVTKKNIEWVIAEEYNPNEDV